MPYRFRRGLVMAGLLVAVVAVAPRIPAGPMALNILVKGVAAAGLALLLVSIAVPNWPAVLRRARQAA
jgi:hypothetical protein